MSPKPFVCKACGRVENFVGQVVYTIVGCHLVCIVCFEKSDTFAALRAPQLEVASISLNSNVSEAQRRVGFHAHFVPFVLDVAENSENH